ncbi:MAG: hypothetical protein JWO56_2163 [Acidobacteria bacterium]|nr:hypothetical protein [Acidobacteriota bacterium]
MREILLGLLAGTLIGATGIGSGSLLTPLLIMAGYPPSTAVSTGLATLVVSKLTGSIAHRSRGNWPGKQGWIVVGGGILGVVIVALVARGGLSPSELFVRRAVAISLFASSIAVWIRTKPQPGASSSDQRSDGVALFLSGAFVGGFVMLTSAGSGSLLVPLLLMVTAWGVPQLAATSNTYGWVAALLSFALHVSMRTFDPHLFLLVLIGLVPGVIGGVVLSPWIDRRSFTPALSIFTLYLAIQLI